MFGSTGLFEYPIGIQGRQEAHPDYQMSIVEYHSPYTSQEQSPDSE